MKRSLPMLCLFFVVGWFASSQANELVDLVDNTGQLRLSLWNGTKMNLSTTNRLEKAQLAKLSLECKSCANRNSGHYEIEKRQETGDEAQTTLVQAQDPGDILNYPFKPPQPIKTWRKPLGWSLVGVGGAAAITGFIFHMVAWDLSSEKVTPAEKPARDKEIDNYMLGAIILYGSGVLVAGTGLVLLLWEEYMPFTPHVVVSPKQASLAISGVF